MIPVAIDLRDPTHSGIGRVARSLARELVQRAGPAHHLQITLCGPPAELERLGVREWGDGSTRVVDWPGGRHSLAAQRAWGGVRRRVGPALWFFPHWDVPWYALPDRYVVMLHDLILVRVSGATSRPRRLLAAPWIRRAVRGAARVAVGSDHTTRDLVAFVPAVAPKLRRVPYAVDDRFFAPPPPLPDSVARFAGAGPFMLSVGNRKRHKNLAVGVEVLRRIPELRWVVAGAWFAPWDEVNDRAVRAGVAERMLVLDRASDDVLHALYHAAACLFFPSRAEGFGLPVLEAIACGTPVVSSNAGPLPDVGGDCAVYCDPDDVEAFVAAVRGVLANPRRQPATCVDRARGMTWARSAEQLANVLEEVGR